MNQPLRFVFSALGLLLLIGVLLAVASPPTYTSTAKLFGVGPLRGSATCINRTGATGPYRVDVSVTGGPPSQALEVFINGVDYGDIMIDSSGAGTLRINNFPAALGAGDTITVQNLTGVFYRKGASTLQRYDLEGTATNIVGVNYLVRYHEFYEDDRLERRWEVTITNAEPFQSVPTFVRTVFVQPLLPGANGTAKLRLRTASFINQSKPGPWTPLANSFPSLANGEVVQVGTSYITMHKP